MNHIKFNIIKGNEGGLGQYLAILLLRKHRIPVRKARAGVLGMTAVSVEARHARRAHKILFGN